MKRMADNAREVMLKRYALRNAADEITETPEDIFARAAREVSQAEDSFSEGRSTKESGRIFSKLLSDFRLVPNGRTLANAGAGSRQLANCFVLPLDDDLGKTEDGIFSILRKAVLVLQSGGGVGFSFGRIRPKGDVVGKGKATGAVSFLKVFDTSFWVIGQGGGRRSACMAVLPVHHPDIFDFIRCKRKEGVIEHFNISVGVTDAFMEAVKNDTAFDLINPRNGEVWETVQARDLFDEIITYAHHNGEPGVLFLDAANRQNPVPHQYTLEATNPCGEQWLGPYENCCMASINLAEHVMKLTNGKSKKLFGYAVDWEKLAETVRETTRWLDNVVEVNRYVPAVPDLEEAAHKNRRIGVSIMGMADMMYLIGVRYGSDRAVDLAGQLMEFIRYHSMQSSIELAQERGPFPGIVGSIYDYSVKHEKRSQEDVTHSTWSIPRPIRSYKHSFGRTELDWKGLLAELKKHGIRNSCQTTIQPTGAIATVAGLEGYGCEPVFALSYVMKTHEGAAESGGDWKELYYESSLFKQVLKHAGLSKKEREAIFEIVRSKGTCQGIDLLPKKIRDVFVVSADIAVSEHVRMQAALQAFTDNAISKTINFPASATKQDVWDAYLNGWALGLKGMTVYVTGSRETVVLETQETRTNRDDDVSSAEPFAVRADGYVGKMLQKHKPEPSVCPECSTQLILQEGCATCPQCAYSHCSV